jgi:hypothetical protein
VKKTFGFRSFSVFIISDKRLCTCTETHHLFIDFSTAYDSINSAQLYVAM